MPVPSAMADEKPYQNGNGVVKPTKVLTLDVPEKPPKSTVATTTVVVPPDGGWGWVVMVACFFCNVIVDGIVLTAGLLLDKMNEDFKVSKMELAFVSSLLSGFYLLAGPFVSALCNRWGFRTVTIMGSIFGSAMFAIAAQFANSIMFMYIVYGVLGGIGFSFVYMPSVITVGYYFEKWRALATGIALCGSGVGTFVFAHVNTYMVNNYGWRECIFLHSGIMLVCILLGLTFRPIEPIEVPILDESELMIEENMTKTEDGFAAIFTKPLPEGRYAYSVPNSVHNTWIGAVSNTNYPTAAEVFRHMERRSSGHGGVLTSANLHNTNKKLEQFCKAHKARLSTPSTPEEMPITQPPLHHLELKTVGEDEEENENGNLLEEDVKPVIMTARRHTVSGRRPGELRRSKSHRESHVDGNRPLYRDDIFFNGSLARIPQYQSQSSIGYHMSVTRMPTEKDVVEDQEEGCKLCPEAVRRTLATMLDVSLLKSPSFMLLGASGFFTMMGFFIPFMYLKDRALESDPDMSISMASLIVSSIGISNTIARIICGILSSFKGINALYINNIAITVGGIATVISGLSFHPAYQFTYAAIFGIAIACFSALRSIIVVDLMGLEKLTNAFGILMLFQGAAAVIGAPIAGIFMDITKSYDVSFYIAGILITISGILCYPLNWAKAWETRKSEKMSLAV